MIKFLLIFILSTLINASENEKFNKLFEYLEKQNITIGQDISTKKLYEIIENNEVYLENGQLNKTFLNKQLSSMLSTKNEQFHNIKKELAKNPNSKVNKEIKYFIDDGNDRVEKSRNNINQNDTEGYFSSMINYVLGFMKN